MRLIDADALANDLEHDVELDSRALDDTTIVGREREKIQFDKDCKQNCIWYLTDAPTVDERKSGCEYCVTDVDGWVKPIEKNGHAFVWYNHLGWHLSLRARGWRGNALINFCPMCGRRLEGEKKNEMD